MGKVLLASGDNQVIDVFTAELAGDGHVVRLAATGQDAYLEALEFAPDLVLLDAALPVFSGIEAAGMLLADPEVPRGLPVLLLTDDEVDPHILERAGIAGVFPKTHAAGWLREKLVAHLGDKAGRDMR